jgi:hypothetical protein
MKIKELFETASGGATGAGAIATVVNPSPGNSKKKKTTVKSVNALDSKVSLFGGPAVIKR